MDTKKYLLKAAEIEQMPGKQKTHFLNSNAIRLNKSLGDAVGLNHIGVHLIYVQPGHDTTEYHKHLYEEECIYVVSGKGLLIIEGDRYILEPGDFVGLPRNEVAHTVINESNEILVCLVMGQRLEQDIAVYPNAKKKLYRNSGVWELFDLEAIQAISPTLPKVKT